MRTNQNNKLCFYWFIMCCQTSKDFLNSWFNKVAWWKQTSDSNTIYIHLQTGGLEIKRIYFASVTILTKYLNGYDENYRSSLYRMLIFKSLHMFLVVGAITSPLSNLLLHGRDYIILLFFLICKSFEAQSRTSEIFCFLVLPFWFVTKSQWTNNHLY